MPYTEMSSNCNLLG